MSFLPVQNRAYYAYNRTAVRFEITMPTGASKNAPGERKRKEHLKQVKLRQLQNMMAVKNLKIGLVASLMLLAGGTINGANAGFLGGKAPGQKQEVAPPVPDTPESQAANQRVERSKTNLDQARKQLEAAKAVLKAADAEFRAARADQDALSLRTQAQRLADSSGLTGVPMDRVPSIPPVPKGAVVTPDAKSPLPSSASEDRIDPVSDSSLSQDMDTSQSAPTPSAAPLHPSATP